MNLRNYDIVGFVPSKDLDRAKGFYVDRLGLEPVRNDGFALVLRSGRNEIRVAKLEAFEPQRGSILGWEAPDISAAVAALEERGVQFVRFPGFNQDERGIWTTPNGDRVAWFRDPDGNTLSLSQRSSKSA